LSFDQIKVLQKISEKVSKTSVFVIFATLILQGFKADAHVTLLSAPSSHSSPDWDSDVNAGFSSFGPILKGSSSESEMHSLGFDYSGYSFLKDDTDATRDRSYPSLNFHWRQVQRGSIWEWGGETGMQFTYHPDGHSAFAFEIPEAYVGTSEDLGPVQFKVGRKLEHWNHLDEAWRLGIWQPRFRWDYIRPEIVGLTGIFLSIRQPAFKFVVMGSPGFIPERGVQVAVENGAVISRSPWFLPPPSEISILSRKTAVEYHLVLPDTMDIVNRSGINFLFKVGEEKKGPWLAAAYAYKPMNQLLLAYDGYLKLNRDGNKVASANVFPRLLFHHLTSVEAGWEESSFRASISALSERPVRDYTPEGWTTQEVKPALALSPSVDFAFQGAKEQPIHLGLSYLRVWGGTAPDRGIGGSFVSEGGSVFESRYPFSQAVLVSLNTSLAALSSSLPNSWNRVSLHTRLLQDIPNQGTVLSWDLRYRPRSNLEFTVGADILGTSSSEVNSNYSIGNSSGQTTNFIDRYRSNDRFHAGMSYVF